MGWADWWVEDKMIAREDYEKFLVSKQKRFKAAGFNPEFYPDSMYPFQRHIMEWACKLGRAAIFADCGLGKTLMQLTWAANVAAVTGKPVLILAPLAVTQQTRREGERFGIPVYVCRSAADVRAGVNVANYEMLHAFEPNVFGGVVLDESSILKSYTGKIRNQIIASFATTPYRLACTATPSPNDFMELGNHSEFLGVMGRTGMLATFFNHDGGETSKWRIKGHAEKPFWEWVASWAVMVSSPSDLGFRQDGYALPHLERHIHTIETEPQEGVLFPVDAAGINERRESRRISVDKRVEKLAAMVNVDLDQWLIWGELNAETDAAERAIPTAVQVSGADSDEHKESTFLGFCDGTPKDLITKTKIGGFGMNWQHCHKMASIGMGDSWEQLYQGERRCWRYGQKMDVQHHIFLSDRDGSVIRNIERKQRQAVEMTKQMLEAMKVAHG